MKIYTVGSSSKGNLYALICAGRALLLEAGIPLSKARKKLPIGLSCCDGMLITHEHGDHAAYAQEYAANGITIWSTQGTREAIGVGREISLGVTKTLPGGWKVFTFPTIHDAANPAGFVIDAPDGERVLFATDTRWLPFTFDAVHHWMIECNYDGVSLDLAVKARLTPQTQAARVVKSHMGQDSVIRFLKAQDLKKTIAVYLLHGSNRHSNGKIITRNIQREFGVPVYWEAKP